MKTIQFDFDRCGNKYSAFEDSDSVSQIASGLDMMASGVMQDLEAVDSMEKRNGFMYSCKVSVLEMKDGEKVKKQIIEFSCRYCDDNGQWYVEINYPSTCVPILRTDSINETKKQIKSQMVLIICAMFDRISKS